MAIRSGVDGPGAGMPFLERIKHFNGMLAFLML